MTPSRAWLLPLLIAALACGGKSDIEQRYKNAVVQQRAAAGASADELVSVGKSGNDTAVVSYAGGMRHDMVGRDSGGNDRDYSLDGGPIVLRARDRSYGFKLVTPDKATVRWKVRLYPDKVKISDNDNDTSPRRIRVESAERAKMSGPNEEPLGTIAFDGKNTVVTNSDGKVRFSKATAKLEPSYGVFLLDQMPVTEKYMVIAELLARNR